MFFLRLGEAGVSMDSEFRHKIYTNIHAGKEYEKQSSVFEKDSDLVSGDVILFDVIDSVGFACYVRCMYLMVILVVVVINYCP